MACYILQASITKSLTILPMVMRKKVKRGPKKNVDSRKKGYSTRATTTSSSCRQMSFFLDSRPKAFLGAHPKALCVKRIESKMHPPFPSFQWFEPLNVFLTFFFWKKYVQCHCKHCQFDTHYKTLFLFMLLAREFIFLSVSDYKKLMTAQSILK